MARIRTIKPKFWDDTKLATVSRDARLTYIGMWNFSDDLGVIISKTVWLKSKIFPHDTINLVKFESWLRELEKVGVIILFSTSGKGSGGEKFYYLPNLTKHQVINRPNYEDLFVEKEKLENFLKDSLINHGIITDHSSQGEEGKGKERKGGEWRAEKHFFSESEIFKKENFEEKLIGTQYEQANVDWYHEQIKNWADSKNEKKFNWLSSAKNWMGNDMKEGKFITKDFKPPANGGKTNQSKQSSNKVSRESINEAFDEFHKSKNPA